jgi:hypothetical protein
LYENIHTNVKDNKYELHDPTRTSMREGDHLEYPGVDGRIILKYFLKKWDGRTWAGLIWLRIVTGGGLL